MRLLHFAFCAALVSSVAMTPAFARGGGGGGGHGGGGGGARGGGGFSGGARGGGGGIAGRGSVGGFGGARGGFGYGGYRGGYWGYGGWGLGFGWGYPYAYGYPSYGYCDPYYYSCGYAPYDYGYSYAPQASAPPVINQYVPQGSPQYAPQSYPQQGYPQQSYPRNTQVYPQNTQNYAPPQPTPSPRSVGTQPFYRTPDFYLIAFSDHTMQAALSFNVEGDTIHYTTREHVEKTAPLSSVDVRFSQQINRDRHVDFKMPQGRTPDLKVALQ
jgi:hypothetical protein